MERRISVSLRTSSHILSLIAHAKVVIYPSLFGMLSSENSAMDGFSLTDDVVVRHVSSSLLLLMLSQHRTTPK
jgi:hypothetical protein